jgi:hypothetical protein
VQGLCTDVLHCHWCMQGPRVQNFQDATHGSDNFGFVSFPPIPIGSEFEIIVRNSIRSQAEWI